jgi:hypothetical protein
MKKEFLHWHKNLFLNNIGLAVYLVGSGESLRLELRVENIATSRRVKGYKVLTVTGDEYRKLVKAAAVGMHQENDAQILVRMLESMKE